MKYTIAMDHCGFYYLIRIQTILWLSELAELFKSGPNSGPDRIETIWSGPQFYSDFKKCFENSDQLKNVFFFIAIGTGEDFRIEFRAKKSGPYK